MVTRFGFQATAVWLPFFSGLGAGEGVVFIHKLSGHMKCLVTHIKEQAYNQPHHTHHQMTNKVIFDCCRRFTKQIDFPQTQSHHTTNTRNKYSFLTSIFARSIKNRMQKKNQCLSAFIHSCAKRFLYNETPAIRNTKT